MKHANFPLNTHLAILQQCEYDLPLYDEWLKAQHVLSSETLSVLAPETMSAKLSYIKAKSSLLQLIMPRSLAVKLAVTLIAPFETAVKHTLVWRAQQHLRALQEKGLVVIGVAGSYGKTTIKHELRHFLSTEHMVSMSPASYNTPLGLASSILKLTSDHDVFIAEIGEYQPGDIDSLLQFLKPDIGVLGPVGFAHGERFGSQEALLHTFSELWRSADAPSLILIDDANRELFEAVPSNVFWYGEKPESQLQLEKVSVGIEGGSGTLLFSDGTRQNFVTNLLQKTQLRNTLPAFLLQQSFRRPIEPLVRALAYVPNTPRRLELHKNPNGTFVIDNSYNTNPGAWKSILSTLTSLSKSGLVVLTPGFVELSNAINDEEHITMAQDLIKLKATIGIIRSRFNGALIKELESTLPSEKLLIGESYNDLLIQLSQRQIDLTYLWLEGGLREMYQ
jgi:UDP-N-acetylmuramoyl-tripeptide--D-alanyl-D-alanine ligase